MTLDKFSDKFFSSIFYDGHVVFYVLFCDFGLFIDLDIHNCTNIDTFSYDLSQFEILRWPGHLCKFDLFDTYPNKTLEIVLYVSLLIHISNQLIKPGFKVRMDWYRSASVRRLQKYKGKIEEYKEVGYNRRI